jgi:hypothetical protein
MGQSKKLLAKDFIKSRGFSKIEEVITRESSNKKSPI